MMYTRVKTASGTVYCDVPAWGNAMDFLDGLGIKVARAAEYPMGNTGLGVHVYFENSDGDEVAYYTPALKNLFVFDVPRKVHASLRAKKTLWDSHSPPVPV